MEKCAICEAVISSEQARQAGHKCARCLAAWNALYEPVSLPASSRVSSPFRYSNHSSAGRRGTSAACPDDDDDDDD